MNLKKKIVALGMVCILAVGMAASAFAADTRAGIDMSTGTYTLHIITDGENWNVTNYCLNVEGNHQVSQNRTVNIYTATGDDDQRWVYQFDADGEYRLKSALDRDYALNIYHPSTPATDHNCDIMEWADNKKDSALHYYSGSTDWTYGRGEICLANYSKNLAACGLGNGNNVVWHNSSSPYYGLYAKWGE